MSSPRPPKRPRGSNFTNIFTDQADIFVAKYQATYGSRPLDPTLVSFGYDGIMKIREAINLTKKEKVQEGLAQVFGISRSADRIEKIYQVKDGQAVELK